MGQKKNYVKAQFCGGYARQDELDSFNNRQWKDSNGENQLALKAAQVLQDGPIKPLGT